MCNLSIFETLAALSNQRDVCSFIENFVAYSHRVKLPFVRAKIGRHQVKWKHFIN